MDAEKNVKIIQNGNDKRTETAKEKCDKIIQLGFRAINQLNLIILFTVAKNTFLPESKLSFFRLLRKS